MKPISIAPLFISLLVAANASAQANATVESVYYPRTMEAGRTYPVQVTMYNSGSVTWTNGVPADGTMFRLGDMADVNSIWGTYRANMSVASLAPGQRHTFSFNVTAPATTSGKQQDKAFDWQMVQERVGWFGQDTPSAFADQRVDVAYAPALAGSSRTAITPSVPVVVAPDVEFSFANFRGANVLNLRYKANCNSQGICSHTGWFHPDVELPALLDQAKLMNINILRIPVVIPPSTAAFVASDWDGATPAAAIAEVIRKTKYFLDQANARGMKVLFTFDGYTKYGYADEIASQTSNCYWKKGFTDIEANARAMVNAIHTHPALYGYDLLNEPLHNASQNWGNATTCLESTPGVADVNAYASVVNAVHAMYNLVRAIDSRHPTTVGEGNIAWMKYWSDVSSFLSYHLYYDNNLDPAIPTSRWAADPAIMKGIQRATIDRIRQSSWYNDRPWPVVITEFGTRFRKLDANNNLLPAPPTNSPAHQVNWYRNYLQGLKAVNAGGMLWSISNRNEFRITNSEDATKDHQMKCLIKGIQASDNPALNCTL